MDGTGTSGHFFAGHERYDSRVLTGVPARDNPEWSNTENKMAGLVVNFGLGGGRRYIPENFVLRHSPILHAEERGPCEIYVSDIGERVRIRHWS
jgi:hypothetical protein